MKEKQLSEKQFSKLGELLSIAINNKKYPHVCDQRRACVLIFSLLQKGYNFWDPELERVIEESGGRFSEGAKKELHEITWVCNELVMGLDNSENENYRLKRFSKK